MRRPRGVRTRLLVAVLAAFTLALAALVAGFNLFVAASLSRSASDQARARAAAQVELLDVSPGGVALAERGDGRTADVPVWVFAGGRRLEAPRVRSPLDAAARALAASGGETADAAEFRLYRLPVRSGGREVATVVGAVSLEPYERTRRLALVASLVFGGVVLAATALALRFLLSAALRPVARMTEQAAAWSERGLDGRFDPGEPYDELTRLAATLDTLLDRVAASLRREQRFSAEVSHELRTPLARVAAEAELALRRERTGEEYRAALEGVLRGVEGLTRTVEALVHAARAEAGLARGTSDAYAAASAAAEACAALAEERGVSLSVVPPRAPLRVGVEGDVAARILQPLVENACRYARREVRVSLVRSGARVVYAVADDGPGVRPDELERIFEPGVRGSAAAAGGGGAGLGLALARRLARAASGEVAAAADGGGRFTAALPAA